MAQFGDGDTSFQAAGGVDGIRRLVDQFYNEMDTSPEASTIRKMHSQDLSEAREKLWRFLCGWLGGPKLYREKYGPIAIPAFHRQFSIGTAERDAWMLCMKKAVEKQPFSAEFKAYFLKEIYVPAERSRNQD